MAYNFYMLAPVLALTLCSFAWSAHIKCDVPPMHWCDDYITAKRCGVLDMCVPSLGVDWTGNSNGKSDLVQVEMNYESMCGPCKGTMKEILMPMYPLIGSIMNLTLVPYGNANETKVGDTYNFTCQHGADECVGNLIETCTINLVNSVPAYLPFLACLEIDRYPTPMKAVSTCAQRFPYIPTDKILECSKSKQGAYMEHEMGEKFRALQPPPIGVPWFVVNGDRTREMNKKFIFDTIKTVCGLYKGPNKPWVCDN